MATLLAFNATIPVCVRVSEHPDDLDDVELVRELLEETLLYQLLHRGHRSSRAVRSANTSGFWPSLRNKSALLLPWMQCAQDFQTLPSFAPPLNDSLQSVTPPSFVVREFWKLLKNQVGGDSSLILRFPTGDPHCGNSSLILSGDMIRRMMSRASNGVYWSLVGLAIYHRGKLSEISVWLLHNGAIHKGVLLEADFCSDIAFVKIKSCIGGPLVNMDGGFFAIIHNIGLPIEATPIDDVFKYLEHFKKHGLDARGSIDQEMENTESRNERTSGQLIKAEYDILQDLVLGDLWSTWMGFIGIIHNVGSHIEALQQTWKMVENATGGMFAATLNPQVQSTLVVGSHEYSPMNGVNTSGDSIDSLLVRGHVSRTAFFVATALCELRRDERRVARPQALLRSDSRDKCVLKMVP
ncbi:hypothetical protein RHGRI_012286 [Rhododendron griersonianum]|uniref:Uncharacterized protein n=1 Tax=Rhododendron griersonianum TaxID=479676 RepID=A0AAV6KQ03_9ERIC|nr:hypothetical protein RHGRI_012286 [Rhododendron griersonianum]